MKNYHGDLRIFYAYKIRYNEGFGNKSVESQKTLSYLCKMQLFPTLSLSISTIWWLLVAVDDHSKVDAY